MTQASVGFHCPECLDRSGQRILTARTIRAAATPYVTFALIAVNVAVYALAQTRTGFVTDYSLIGDLSAPRGFGVAGIGVGNGEWYRIFTGAFLHANTLHLLMNMYVLYILGRQLEGPLGRAGFAAVYTTSLITGSLGVLLLEPDAITVGASGAVFGLFGFAVAAQRARGINPFDTGLGGIILINLAFTFLVPNISIGGHLGGLIGGFIAGQVTEVVTPRLGWPKLAGAALVALVGGAGFLACLAV